MGADGRWSLTDAWDWTEACARTADASVRRTDSWVPPVEEELVRAARASALSRWYPFTSHNYLRLVDGQDDGNELTGCISFDTGGPDGSPVFRVWSGLLLRAPDPLLVLTTADAVTAVEALIALLAQGSTESRPR